MAVACLLTASWVLIAGIHSPGYFPVLRVHVWTGVAALVLFIPGVALHIARYPDLRVGRSLLAAAAVAGGAGALLLGIDRPDDVGNAEIGILLLQASFVTAIVFGVTRPFRTSPRGGAATGAVLVTVIAGALVSGVVIWLLRGDARVPLERAHSLLGILSAALMVPHLRVVRRWASEGRLRPRALVGLIAVGVITVWSTAQLVQLGFEAAGGNAPTITVPLTAAERAQTPLHTFDEELLNDSASCGDAQCHPTITDQWSGSAHRYAADNRLYRSVVASLVAERGVDEAIFCANCHDPVRVLAGTVQRDYRDGAPPPGEGVNCVTCHASIAEAGPRPANGGFVYRAPLTYPGASDAERNANLLLDPRAHRAGFGSGEHATGGTMCRACHRVALSPDMGAAVSADVQSAVRDGLDSVADCNHCHMPTATPVPGRSRVLEIESPPQYDHDMAAMNVDLVLYALHDEADVEALRAVAARARAFRDGEVALLEASASDTRLAATDYMQLVGRAWTGGPVLAVDVSAERDGHEVLVTVTSRNTRSAHPFPIGPFDLQEVWQEVSLTDGQGREVVRVGAPDPDGRLPADAHRLGGIEWQRDGQPLQGHRIWDVSRISDVRQVRPGRGVTDQYRIAVPLDAPAPLTVEATWSLRRVNPEFAARAFPGEDVRFPIHRLVTASASVKSIPSGGQVQETARPQAPGSVSR